MANMGYCKFRNTLRDLTDCKDEILDRVDNAEEDWARLRLLHLCKRLAEDCPPNIEAQIKAARERWAKEEAR